MKPDGRTSPGWNIFIFRSSFCLLAWIAPNHPVILNLSSYTNTDLKLQYGVANLAFLSECDERFLLLIRTLYQWACILLDDGYTKEAIQVAEYSIQIGSDISGCYYMLADYYRMTDDDAALDTLRKSAETITGFQANSIKEYLNKSQES